LISYVYNLAFSGSRGVDYGFAAAITIIIFVIVGVITLFQFRYTRMWEEVSENV
jgi:ABC-type sugar transport system permease subunit